MTYTVQDSQGITFGVFNDLEKAKEALVGQAESIFDVIEVRDVMHLVPKPEDTSTVVATVFDKDGAWGGDLEGFTVIQWHKENGNY